MCIRLSIYYLFYFIIIINIQEKITPRFFSLFCSGWQLPPRVDSFFLFVAQRAHTPKLSLSVKNSATKFFVTHRPHTKCILSCIMENYEMAHIRYSRLMCQMMTHHTTIGRVVHRDQNSSFHPPAVVRVRIRQPALVFSSWQIISSYVSVGTYGPHVILRRFGTVSHTHTYTIFSIIFHLQYTYMVDPRWLLGIIAGFGFGGKKLVCGPRPFEM